MKAKLFFLVLALASFTSVNAQLVWTEPGIPMTNQSVTVYFDATQGSGGLAGYTGDVYAHTGVITDQSSGSSDWKYVKTGWGQNTAETKLTRIDTDLYTLEITPDIRNYYGVPGTELIEQMAFVFRSATQVGGSWLEGKTATGGDIFIDVFEAGLQVSFVKPEAELIVVELNDMIQIEVASNEADNISLFFEGELYKYVEGNTLIDSIEVVDYGSYLVEAIAENATETAVDSFRYVVRPEVNIAELPAGVKDGINYIDNSTVILSLVAPYKDFIYVLGDFNDWEVDNDYYMNQTPDGLRFWLQIDGLVPLQEYAFQYYIDNELRIADPYTDKILDPWNDSWIPEENYPNLKPYPTGKTEGITAVLQTGQTAFSWEVENFEAPAEEDLIIYECLVRDFSETSSFQEVIDKLDYLEDLGINALELMPINEFEGNDSWGYNPSFYFAVDKYYGTKNKFKELVDECHKRGIAVIIDLVLNHSYDQSPFVQMYFDGSKPTEENPWYNREHNFENPEAHWGNDFNHEADLTKALVDSVNAFWMSEYKIDGFRFDFTKGFGNNYKSIAQDEWGSNYDADRIALLKRMADEILVRNEDAYIILEHLAVNSEDKELAEYGMMMWGNMNHSYNEASMGWHNESNFAGISYKSRGWSQPKLVGYMESHDEERLMFKNITYGNDLGSINIKDTVIGLSRMELVNTFFITVPGPKMIWQFGELGYDYSINYNGRLGRKPVRWDYLNQPARRKIYDLVSYLSMIKKEYDVFNTTDFTMAVAGANKRIYLNHADMNAVILGNFGVETANIGATFQHTGIWYDILSGDSIDVTNTSMDFEFEASEYKIFTDVRIAPPVWMGIGEGNRSSSSMLIYPNPNNGQMTLELNIQETEHYNISIINTNGQQLMQIADAKLQAGIHEYSIDAGNTLSRGIYLLKLSSGKHQQIQKLMIY